MNSNYNRWDGEPPMNSKEQTSRNRVAGCGGFDNPFSPTYQNPLNSPYSFESLAARTRLAFALKHSPEFNRSESLSSQSGISDMRSRLQREIDSSKMASRGIDSFYKQNNRSNAAAPMKRSVAVQSSPTLYEALNTLNDVIDYVVLKYELAARSLKLNPIKILGRVGLVTGIVGLAFDAWDAYDDPTFENITIAVLGGGFFVIAILAANTILAPIWAAIAFAGAIVLLTWKVGKVVYIAIEKNK